MIGYQLEGGSEDVRRGKEAKGAHSRRQAISMVRNMPQEWDDRNGGEGRSSEIKKLRNKAVMSFRISTATSREVRGTHF
jgi:hypothetical protein